jgi:diguanylate cyclase (GGDEF)-like protein
LWRHDLLFLHVGGDILTTIAYLIIPAALFYLVRRRSDLAFNRVFMLFAAFILLCGLTHMVSMLNVWHGFYYIEGLLKLATGIVSITTAIVVWKLVPKALTIPDRYALIDSNNALTEAQESLQRVNLKLEQRVKQRTAELEKLAITDELTGINNRRALMQELESEINRSKRNHQAFSMIMIDLDHFKSINDQHGHAGGDNVIRHACSIFTSLTRVVDTVARYGGEEFIILVPDTSASAAATLAERIRKAIESDEAVVDGKSIKYTASFGVCEYQQIFVGQQMIDCVDKALYAAKEKGRNCVVVADESLTE